MDAPTRGTLEGAQLLVNIVAMLVVFVALVALVNLVIAPYTLQGMLGWALAPLAWLAGIPWSEARPPARCSAPRPSSTSSSRTWNSANRTNSPSAAACS